jgi:flavorubredoxin
MEIVAPGLMVNWVPDENEIQKCFDFGKEFAKVAKK